MSVKGKETFTVTFCDVGENGIGMQQIGEKKETGYSFQKLKDLFVFFLEMGIVAEFLRLDDEEEGACVLVVRDACDFLCQSGSVEDLFIEQKKFAYDKKAIFRGTVKNKLARWNLCMGEEDQDANIEEGKGTVVKWEKMPLLNEVRKYLELLTGDEIRVAEGNYYYDTKKCHIGPHGDAERLEVVAIRLGADFPLFFQKYFRHKRMGERMRIDLKAGDMYIMSEKATGNDWKKSSIETFRHAAGFKYSDDKHWKGEKM
jgi:hypothetical protein